MIGFSLYDFGEYGGLKSLYKKLTEKKVFLLSDHIKNEIGYSDRIEDINKCTLLISGMVSEEQINLVRIARNLGIYTIGYYDFPFYERDRLHSAYLDEFDEIWTCTDKCNKAIKALGYDAYFIGNDNFSDTTVEIRPKNINTDKILWVGQHGDIYEKTFLSMIKEINEDILVLPHPSKNGKFESDNSNGKCEILYNVKMNQVLPYIKYFMTWESTAIMNAYYRGKVCFCYENDCDEHNNVFIANSVGYGIFKDTMNNILSMKLSLGRSSDKDENMSKPALNYALHRLKNIARKSLEKSTNDS